MRPITAADLMSPEVLTVREDLPVADLAAFLMRHDITGAPVVDAEGRLVGVVSVVDIADLVSRAVRTGSRSIHRLRRGRAVVRSTATTVSTLVRRMTASTVGTALSQTTATFAPWSVSWTSSSSGV